MHLAGLLALLVACLVVQAFFAASEIALVVADELKVRAESERGRKESRMLDALLAGRDRVLALTLTGSNLATAVAAAALTAFMHELGPRASYLAPFILAPVTLLVGESLPKLVTLSRPLEFARRAAPALRLLEFVFAPLLWAETVLSRGLRRLVGISPELGSVFLTREDLALLVRRHSEAAPAGAYDQILPAEGHMISRIFHFAGADARKAMVPLVNVEAVPLETPLAGAIEVVRREGFSRLPVFDNRIFNLVGIVHVFDLLEAPDLSRPVGEVMRPVSYFAESTPLAEILLAMQRTGENMAVVVDEYGGASGIITLADLLGEIVGDIEDEHAEGEQLVRVLNARALAVLGQTPIAELNERFSLKLPEGDEYATIAGLVVERLGHIPRSGEKLEIGDLTLTVTRSDARAVRELLALLARPLRPEQMRRR